VRSRALGRGLGGSGLTSPRSIESATAASAAVQPLAVVMARSLSSRVMKLTQRFSDFPKLVLSGVEASAGEANMMLGIMIYWRGKSPSHERMIFSNERNIAFRQFYSVSDRGEILFIILHDAGD